MPDFTDMESGDESRQFRAVIRDLSACLALPALWSRREPSSIAVGLLDALVSMLRLNVAYIRLNDSNGSMSLEAVRPAVGLSQEFLRLFHAAAADTSDSLIMPSPAGNGTLHIARYTLDLQEEGFVVVGAERADFPQEMESFVARAAITQAALSLRAARSLAEVRRSKQMLEEKVRERTAELERSHAARLEDLERQRRLEQQLRQAQKMESIGTLAGGIAHDFNNILNIINGYASVIAEQAKADETIESCLAVINKAVERGASIVRQLLTFARKGEAPIEPINASKVVSELANLLSRTFPKHIKVIADIDQRLPAARADPVQINQALLNLCVNSRDAMPAGGSLLLKTSSIDGAQLRLSHGHPVVERYICIEVKDTGQGMDAVVRSRIFEPFFTTKGIGQGTGLGLPMVYAIVKNHNGFIDVDSEPGRGTAFRLYFPAAGAEEQANDTLAPTTCADSGRAHGTRGTILVAEDEAPMADLIRKLLSRSGFEVLLARDGEEAIDLYRRHKHEIDVVLLDLGLPKIAGWDVIRNMKQENSNLNLIVASGYIEPELKSEMSYAGVREFIYKPYRIDQLVDRLRAAVENRGLNK